MKSEMGAFLRRGILWAFICFVWIMANPQAALAVDYNGLSWDTFVPAEGTKLTTNTASIDVRITDLDGLAEAKMYVDNMVNPVAATITFTDAELGGG